MYKLLLIIATVLLILFNAALVLAENGTVGPTSTGSAGITIVIPPRLTPTVTSSGQIKYDTNLKLEDFNQVVISDNGTTKVIVFIPKTN